MRFSRFFLVTPISFYRAARKCIARFVRLEKHFEQHSKKFFFQAMMFSSSKKRKIRQSRSKAFPKSLNIILKPFRALSTYNALLSSLKNKINIKRSYKILQSNDK